MVDLRQEEDPQDPRDEARGDQMAPSNARPRRGGTAPRASEDHPQRDRLHLAGDGEGRRNPHPLRQALQARDPPHDRAGLPAAAHPRAWHALYERHRALGPTVASQCVAIGAEPGQGPRLHQRGSRAVPRLRSDHGHRQPAGHEPDRRSAAAVRTDRRPGPDSNCRGSSPFDRGAAPRGGSPVGDRPVLRDALRRAASPARGKHRLRSQTNQSARGLGCLRGRNRPQDRKGQTEHRHRRAARHAAARAP